MGNNLTIAGPGHQGVNHLLSDSYLGNKVKNVLANKTIKGFNDDGTEIIDVPINKQRACCMDVLRKEDEINTTDFIIDKVPYALNDNLCKYNGQCLVDESLALQVTDPSGKEYCSSNGLNKVAVNSSNSSGKIKRKNQKCDSIMVNNCAKTLYDQGCLICTKDDPTDKNCVPKWNTNNVNCFTRDRGRLYDGLAECSCINSPYGFTLNTNPGDKIRGGLEFTSLKDNPYVKDGIDNKTLSSGNTYTKYSLDILDNPASLQYPQLLDEQCQHSVQSVRGGTSNPYLLYQYRNNNDITLCLNSISIGNSQIGKANMTNIQQSNTCGQQGQGNTKNKNAKDLPIKEGKELIKEKKEAVCRSKGFKTCEKMKEYEKEEKLNKEKLAKEKIEEKIEEEKEKIEEEKEEKEKEKDEIEEEKEKTKEEYEKKLELAREKKCISEGYKSCKEKLEKEIENKKIKRYFGLTALQISVIAVSLLILILLIILISLRKTN
tara:strand:+ start:815 stop:2281 length:1467 start_codon:yes stop_codon:yes gene_type:complete